MVAKWPNAKSTANVSELVDAPPIIPSQNRPRASHRVNWRVAIMIGRAGRFGRRSCEGRSVGAARPPAASGDYQDRSQNVADLSWQSPQQAIAERQLVDPRRFAFTNGQLNPLVLPARTKPHLRRPKRPARPIIKMPAVACRPAGKRLLISDLF